MTQRLRRKVLHAISCAISIQYVGNESCKGSAILFYLIKFIKQGGYVAGHLDVGGERNLRREQFKERTTDFRHLNNQKPDERPYITF